ncbi:MAG: CDP-alcohol phosphatidyltransferase family protein, partial [Desulfobacterales bacterium]
MKTDNRIKRVLSHPNTLTLFRVVAVPIVVILMIYPNRAFTAMAAFLFSAAAITDYLDGYLARRRGLETTLGKVMDPVADKLLVSSAFIMITSHNW